MSKAPEVYQSERPPVFTSGRAMLAFLKGHEFNPYERKLEHTLEAITAAQTPKVRCQFIEAVKGPLKGRDRSYLDRLVDSYVHEGDYENEMSDPHSVGWERRQPEMGQEIDRAGRRRGMLAHFNDIFWEGQRHHPLEEHPVTEVLRNCLKVHRADLQAQEKPLPRIRHVEEAVPMSSRSRPNRHSPKVLERTDISPEGVLDALQNGEHVTIKL